MRCSRKARASDAGLSLIEVIVVIAIVSILSLGSLFLMRPSGQQDADWRRLSATYDRLRHEAITTQMPLALELSKEGWRSAQWNAGKSAWESAEEPSAWQANLAQPAVLPLRVVFLPSGLASGLTLRFDLSNGGSVSCAASQISALSCSQT